MHIKTRGLLCEGRGILREDDHLRLALLGHPLDEDPVLTCTVDPLMTCRQATATTRLAEPPYDKQRE